jgi:hypothetical protein
MKNCRIFGGLVGGALTSLAVAASAEPQGLFVGLERGFGLEYYSESAETNGTTTTNSGSSLGLGAGEDLSPYSDARVGVDYVMPSGLSLGGAAGLWFNGRDLEAEGGQTTVTNEGPSKTGLLLNPRAGYVMMLSQTVGIWPRGGFTILYENTSTPNLIGNGETETSATDFALTLELPLLLMPAEYFGFLVAPTLDYALSRSIEVDGDESDADLGRKALGIHLGIVGVL